MRERPRDFQELISEQNLVNGNYVCVGLDTNYTVVAGTNVRPQNAGQRKSYAERQLAHNLMVLEATKDKAAVYKPNLAFYVALGAEGIGTLKRTIKEVHRQAKNVPVLIDAKVGDIDSTNNGWVEFLFDELGADAITVHPTLGPEAASPFLARKEKGIFVLARTSNPGGGRYQDLAIATEVPVPLEDPITTRDTTERPLGMPLEAFYIHLAASVARDWNYNGNCGVVAGGNKVEEARYVREVVGAEMPILIPGVGAQGGHAKDVVPVALRIGERGMINSSRGIIFAKRQEGESDIEAIRREFLSLDDEIRTYQRLAA